MKSWIIDSSIAIYFDKHVKLFKWWSTEFSNLENQELQKPTVYKILKLVLKISPEEF